MQFSFFFWAIFSGLSSFFTETRLTVDDFQRELRQHPPGPLQGNWQVQVCREWPGLEAGERRRGLHARPEQHRRRAVEQGGARLRGEDPAAQLGHHPARRLRAGRLRAPQQDLQELVQHAAGEQGALAARLELGQGRVWQSRAHLQRAEPAGFRGSVLGDLQHQPRRAQRDRRRVRPDRGRRERQEGLAEEGRGREGPAGRDAGVHSGHHHAERGRGRRRGERCRRGGEERRHPVLRDADREGRHWRDGRRYHRYVP